jgi:hypothetical protein
MKKPTQLKFGHRDFKIKYISKKEASKRKIYGEVDTSTNTITIDKSLDDKVNFNTIIHEVIHVIAEHYAWNLPAKSEELVCETTGNALSDVFNQNPKLIEYLAFAFKK